MKRNRLLIAATCVAALLASLLALPAPAADADADGRASITCRDTSRADIQIARSGPAPPLSRGDGIHMDFNPADSGGTPCPSILPSSRGMHA